MAITTKNRADWTARDRLENELTQRGMFPEQATKVIEEAEIEIESICLANSACHFTWNAPEYEYPDSLYVLITNAIVKPIALSWIDRNIPKAWFRPMFA